MTSSIDPKFGDELLKLAEAINNELNGSLDPRAVPKYSFVLVVDEFGEGDGHASYVSNLKAAGLVKKVGALFDRLRRAVN